MRKSSPKAGLAGVIGGIILLKVACGAAWAETADASSAAAAPASTGETAKDSGPFGGCEPIGLTASGELVFPLECKKAIKKAAETPLASDEKSPAADKQVGAEAKPTLAEKPAVADKPAVASESSAAEAKPAALQSEAAAKAEMPKPSTTETETTATAASKPATETTAAAAKTAADKPAAPPEKKAAQQTAGSKKASRHAAKQGESSIKPAATLPAPKRLAMVKPTTQPAPVKPPADSKAKLRTAAAGPACTHFRSYNPTTRSYLGYDGHMYACH